MCCKAAHDLEGSGVAAEVHASMQGSTAFSKKRKTDTRVEQPDAPSPIAVSHIEHGDTVDGMHAT